MSQEYPQGQQSQQPGGYQHYPPPQPPPGYELVKKKTHKFRNFVVMPIAALIALGIAISVGTSGSKPDKAPVAAADAGAPQTRNDPHPVAAVGQPVTIGKHRLNSGWKLTYEEMLGTKLVGQVTNISGDASTAFFSVKFLKGTTVIANFQCITEELEPNQVQQVECYNSVTTTKRVNGWTKVTAEATF